MPYIVTVAELFFWEVWKLIRMLHNSFNLQDLSLSLSLYTFLYIYQNLVLS